MFRFIKSISLSVQFLIPLFAVLVFVPEFFLSHQPGTLVPEPGQFYHPTEGLLYGLWARFLTTPNWIHQIVNCLIVIGCTVILLKNDQRHLLMGQRSFAIGFVFIFLVGSTGQLSFFHPAFLAGLFLLLAYGFMLDHYKTEDAYYYAFGAGFCLGVGTLLYPPLALTLPVVGIGIALLVSATWRHWAVLVWGMIIPLGIAAIVLMLTGNLAYEADSFLTWFAFSPSIPPAFIRGQPFLAGWFGLILIWIIMASIRYRNPRIQSRQLFMVNFILFLLFILMALFMRSVSSEIILLMIIPVTFLITYWSLNVKRGWVRDLFFLSMMGSWIFFRLQDLILGK